jgi:hypothetical protein
MFHWLPELRSNDFNGPMLCRGFTVSAGGAFVRIALGVKGSQVQILSSRRSTSLLTRHEMPVQWASLFRDSILFDCLLWPE